MTNNDILRRLRYTLNKDCGDQFLRKFLKGLSVWCQVSQSAGNNPAAGEAMP